MASPQQPKIAKRPSIRRLPQYLSLLRQMRSVGRPNVSSAHLACDMGLEAIVVRKDLGITGIEGRPRIGYEVDALIKAIEEFLGWNDTSSAFLVGAGHLGSALLGYGGFADHGLDIVAAFDTDPGRVGTMVHGKAVFGMDRLAELRARMQVHLGILCVPASAAQAVAELMVDAGIRGIWNFTPVKLKTPDDVVTHQEDLASGLAVLSVALSQLFATQQD